jgi:hypothetical protein
MRTKHAARFLSWFLLACSAHASYAQDVNGDLNTNIGAGSSVDSNNNTNAETNNYNSGAPGAMSNPVPTAMAPTMMGGGGNDSCLIPSSKGFQISLFGIAEGSMEQDEQCNRRKDARLMGAPQQLGGLGLQVSGISVMCSDPRVFRAMALANTPCPVNDVATGRLLIGRDAFVKYRANPDIFVVGYAESKAFWDALLLIGEDLPNVETINRDVPSLSDRFRRRSGPDNNQPPDNSKRGDGSGEAVTDVGDGG